MKFYLVAPHDEVQELFRAIVRAESEDEACDIAYEGPADNDDQDCTYIELQGKRNDLTAIELTLDDKAAIVLQYEIN